MVKNSALTHERELEERHEVAHDSEEGDLAKGTGIRFQRRIQRHLRFRISGDSSVPHHSGRGIVVRTRSVQYTPVVPDSDIARFPVVEIGARRLTGEGREVGQERLRLSFVEARDAVSVPPDVERL